MRSTTTISFWILAGTLTALGAPGGRLACDGRVYDYGVITNAPGATVSRVFSLRNTGRHPLRITRVRVCCGASYRLESDTIAPSGQTELRVSVSLAGRAGPQRKAFYVHSTDRQQPVFQLLLTGTIVVPPTTAPPEAAP